VIRTPVRDRLRKHLSARGIQTLVHYPLPIHRQRAFRGLRPRPGPLPETERHCREVLSLPLFPEMKDRELETVASSIRDFFR
jgi:dTDP-4-amino-4,6-dideoxygalactose transaminase